MVEVGDDGHPRSNDIPIIDTDIHPVAVDVEGTRFSWCSEPRTALAGIE
jgi:hypothetical protein